MGRLDAFLAEARAARDPSALEALRLGSHGLLETEDLPKSYTPVFRSRELERILLIPRRAAPSPVTPVRAKVYRFTGGPEDAPMSLWPLQEQALAEALEARGLFAPIAVGGGKTLVAALLPTVLDAPRAVVLTSAGLVHQAKVLIREYRKHFAVRDDVRWLSYGVLSSAKSSRLLEKINPLMIVADEAQALASGSSARTKRFLRYMKAHPETIFCALSGTITKRSLRDFEHLLRLALKTRSPLPRDWPILTEWSEAVDGHRGGTSFRPPGALLDLLAGTDPPPPGATTPLARARYAVRRRLTDTAGVVASSAGSSDARLVIRLVDPPESPAIREALDRLASCWERPDGEQIAFALDYARLERQLKVGGYYRWLWPGDVPDYTWLDARARYHRALRDFLHHRAKEELDSPLLVERAIERGEVSVEGYGAWKKERARLPQPPTRWVWLTDRVVRWAASWLAEAPGIAWIDSTVPGRVLARLADVPWYGAGPEAAKAILREGGTRSFAASIRAHGVGRNLQAYSRALVLTGVPTGAIVEQLLGRLHRPGQAAAEVVFEVPRCFRRELEMAMADARFIEETVGNRQKILSATIERAVPEEVDALLAAKSGRGVRRVEDALAWKEAQEKERRRWATDEAAQLNAETSNPQEDAANDILF